MPEPIDDECGIPAKPTRVYKVSGLRAPGSGPDPVVAALLTPEEYDRLSWAGVGATG